MPSDLHKTDPDLYTISDLIEYKPPYVTSIIEGGLLNVGNRMFIFGAEGSWKSMLAMHLAYCLARGSLWMGLKTTPCNILRIQVELPLYIEKQRCEKYCSASERIFLARYFGQATSTDLEDKVKLMAKQYAYPSNTASWSPTTLQIDSTWGWEAVKKKVEAFICAMPSAPTVLIFDPLYRMFGGDLSDGTDARKLFDWIDEARSKYSLTPVVIHHSRKAHVDGEGKVLSMGSQDATGSRHFINWADTILRIDPDPADKTKTVVHLEFTKHRNATIAFPSYDLRWNRDTLHPEIINVIKSEDSSGTSEIRSESDLKRLE